MGWGHALREQRHHCIFAKLKNKMKKLRLKVFHEQAKRLEPMAMGSQDPWEGASSKAK